MPELPEVESIARALRGRLAGRTVLRLTVRRPGILDPGEASTVRAFPARFLDACRKGKILLLNLEGERTLAVHFRMTGSFYFRREGAPPRVHTHLDLHLDDGMCLGFRDPRRFGRLWLLNTADADRSAPLAGLGPDVLAIDRSAFLERIGSRRRMMKPLLLDQSVLAGLGNIYADESLHRAGIHPEQPAHLLPGPRLERLWEETIAILRAAVLEGGSSIRDFVDSDDVKGGYQAFHRVYDRGGDPCRSCGRKIRRIVVAQRGTWFCPRCQPMRGSPAGRRVR